jgi:predicted enzyme related to lactoylglutathione lyase
MGNQNKMVNSRLALVILAVPDLERATRFYREAFLWPQTVDSNVYVEFELVDNQRFGLYKREAFAHNTGQAPVETPEGYLTGTEIYFYTDDIQESISKLEKVGARRLSALQMRDWGDEAAYFADLDGNVIVLARDHD